MKAYQITYSVGANLNINKITELFRESSEREALKSLYSKYPGIPVFVIEINGIYIDR